MLASRTHAKAVASSVALAFCSVGATRGTEPFFDFSSPEPPNGSCAKVLLALARCRWLWALPASAFCFLSGAPISWDMGLSSHQGYLMYACFFLGSNHVR